MRTGNPIDGMYFFLLVLPFIMGIWIGDLSRKKIVSHLAMEGYMCQYLSACLGVLAEILIIITGILVGLLLLKLI